MNTKPEKEMLIADRIWIATAQLHQAHPHLKYFTRDQIRTQLETEGLLEGMERGSINVHLKEHCVANVPASSGKYRMLYEDSPGRLRLFRDGDLTHPSRVQRRKPSKSVPKCEDIPDQYRSLLDWYEKWNKESGGLDMRNWEDDPLIRLIGSGKHIWAEEHADEYVNRLREDIL